MMAKISDTSIYKGNFCANLWRIISINLKTISQNFFSKTEKLELSHKEFSGKIKARIKQEFGLKTDGFSKKNFYQRLMDLL